MVKKTHQLLMKHKNDFSILGICKDEVSKVEILFKNVNSKVK